MDRADVHVHTNHSHGKHSVREMYERARELDLAVLGFSEHSPRPEAYSYPKEYREHLSATFPAYIAGVQALKELPGRPRVLLGLEMDYFPREGAYLKHMVTAYPYDYIIGSVHYLGAWGFDFSAEDWKRLREEDIYRYYGEYFKTLTAMANSGLAHIAAHPDIIKIFSVDYFHNWLRGDEAKNVVREALLAVKNNDMAMEISSAGLRKPCREIYPGPVLMEMAAAMDMPISINSDAHNKDDLMNGFDELIAYAKEYGYRSSVYVSGGQMHPLPL